MPKRREEPKAKKYELRDRSKPAIAKTASKKTTNGHSIGSMRERLKQARINRAFNALPSLSLDQNGLCRINTGKMSPEAVIELMNYAFLVNKYAKEQRGGRIKIKSTKDKRRDQANFCSTVRGKNPDLFSTLGSGKQPKAKTAPVVAHVPDQCIAVESFGNKFNQMASPDMSGLGESPGWLPMQNQTNGLVAQLGTQTLNSSNQETGPYFTEFIVDGIKPTGLMPVTAWTNANNGVDPLGAESDDEDDDDEDDDDS